MSDNIPSRGGSNSPEDRTPVAVTETLVHLRVAVGSIQERLAEHMGADVVSDCFGRVMSAVTQATTSILAVAGQYQTRLEELEEAEMRRRIAADPLGNIPAEVDPTQVPLYIHSMLCVLQGINIRLSNVEDWHAEVQSRLESLTTIHESFHDRLTELHQDFLKDVGELPRKDIGKSSSSKFGKLRKVAKDRDLRHTSEMGHKRKVSVSASIKSRATSFHNWIQRSTSAMPFHHRRASEGNLPAQTDRSARGTGTKLGSISEFQDPERVQEWVRGSGVAHDEEN